MTAPLSPPRRPSSRGLFPSSDGALPQHPTVEPGRLPSDAPGATIRITVLHLGGREICAKDARDMGLTAGAIVGPREWAVLLGHSGKVWGRVG